MMLLTQQTRLTFHYPLHHILLRFKHLHSMGWASRTRWVRMFWQTACPHRTVPTCPRPSRWIVTGGRRFYTKLSTIRLTTARTCPPLATVTYWALLLPSPLLGCDPSPLHHYPIPHTVQEACLTTLMTIHSVNPILPAQVRALSRVQRCLRNSSNRPARLPRLYHTFSRQISLSPLFLLRPGHTMRNRIRVHRRILRPLLACQRSLGHTVRRRAVH